MAHALVRAGLFITAGFWIAGCPEPSPDERPNEPPVAFPLEIATLDGQVRQGLVHAEDPDDDVLLFLLDEPPAVGEVTVAPDGRFTYQAPLGSALDSETVDAFTFVATDGDLESEPATVTVTILPRGLESLVVIEAGPSDPSNEAEPAFVLRPSVPGDLFCRLDGAEAEPCESPVRVGPLGEGEHRFEAWIAGTPNPPARHRWTVDLTPPSTTLDVGPESPTRQTEAVLVFHADEPATFDCRLGEGDWTPCESPVRLEDLAEGAYHLEVRAVDLAGNVEPDPPLWAWTVDMTPPTAVVSSGPGWTTANPSPTFALEADEPSTFRCRVNASPWAPCPSDLLVEDAGFGAHLLEVVAIDEAGNVQPRPTSRPWYAAPTVSEILTAPGYLPLTEATLSFSAFAAVSRYECRLNDGAWETCESPITYTGLAEAVHAFSVRTVEVDGTVEPMPPSVDFVVDLTPPTVAIASGPPPRTNATSANLVLEADEPVEFHCSLNEGSFAPCQTPHEVSDLLDGGHVLDVYGIDRAGHESETVQWTWEVDTVPPSVTITSGPDQITSETSATIAFECDKPPCTFACKLGEESWSPCESPVEYVDLGRGPQHVSVRATDDVGNVSLISGTWTWFVDALPIDEVATHGHATCATLTDGSLWCWGAWGAHRVGAQDGWSGLSVGGNLSCALRAGGTLWCFDSASSDEPAQIGVEDGWAGLAAGQDFRCGLREEGTLWCWGLNSRGQLGLGDTTARAEPTQVGADDDWIDVAVNGQHACGLRGEGELWCWGYNSDFQLGLGDRTNRTSPTRVGTESDWGRVAAGSSHTCGIRADGQLWCWGRNRDGQLGLGNTFDRAIPQRVGTEEDWRGTAAGTSHTCGIRDDGRLWCWGNNQHGATGREWLEEPDRQIVPLPVDADGATGWASVVLGTSRTCGLREIGDLWCWGSNSVGQLGTGLDDGARYVPVREATARSDWRGVFAGTFYTSTCAIDGGESLWCWGRDTPVETGVLANRQAPVPVGGEGSWTSVAMGSARHCGIRSTGEAWCWRPGDDVLPGRWAKLAAGGWHSCGIAEDGALWCWGANDQGQLGDGTQEARSDLFNVAPGTAWLDVATGNRHTCAVRADASLWCWGDNGAGQVGIDSTESPMPTPTEVEPGTRWASVSAAFWQACGVQSDGSLWCWGWNSSGQLGLGDTATRRAPVQVAPGSLWARVASGRHHTCGIQSDESLWCWGHPGAGRLGNGTLDSHRTPAEVAGGARWSDVAVSDSHSCGVQEDGSLWCWGTNGYGERGDGRAWRHVPELVVWLGIEP